MHIKKFAPFLLLLITFLLQFKTSKAQTFCEWCFKVEKSTSSTKTARVSFLYSDYSDSRSGYRKNNTTECFKEKSYADTKRTAVIEKLITDQFTVKEYKENSRCNEQEEQRNQAEENRRIAEEQERLRLAEQERLERIRIESEQRAAEEKSREEAARIKKQNDREDRIRRENLRRKDKEYDIALRSDFYNQLRNKRENRYRKIPDGWHYVTLINDINNTRKTKEVVLVKRNEITKIKVDSLAYKDVVANVVSGEINTQNTRQETMLNHKDSVFVVQFEEFYKNTGLRPKPVTAGGFSFGSSTELEKLNNPITIRVNNKVIGTLDSGDSRDVSGCNSQKSLKVNGWRAGEYKYEAQSRLKNWKGSFEIKDKKCTSIPLNITEPLLGFWSKSQVTEEASIIIDGEDRTQEFKVLISNTEPTLEDASSVIRIMEGKEKVSYEIHFTNKPILSIQGTVNLIKEVPIIVELIPQSLSARFFSEWDLAGMIEVSINDTDTLEIDSNAKGFVDYVCKPGTYSYKAFSKEFPRLKWAGDFTVGDEDVQVYLPAIDSSLIEFKTSWEAPGDIAIEIENKEVGITNSNSAFSMFVKNGSYSYSAYSKSNPSLKWEGEVVLEGSVRELIELPPIASGKMILLSLKKIPKQVEVYLEGKLLGQILSRARRDPSMGTNCEILDILPREYLELELPVGEYKIEIRSQGKSKFEYIVITDQMCKKHIFTL